MLAIFVIAISGSATQSGTDGEVDNQGAVYVSTAVARAAPAKCPSARRAVKFYARRLTELRERMGAPAAQVHTPSGCPRYLAKLLKRKAAVFRRIVERWIEMRTLRDFRVYPDSHAWHKAVREAQRPYPGTHGWLLSCSASEGGHGRWVLNNEGSGAGGWLQFMSGTFWRMWFAAKDDVTARGYIVPASASSWQSPLGQALAGAWGVTHGRAHEWYGGGC